MRAVAVVCIGVVMVCGRTVSTCLAGNRMRPVVVILAAVLVVFREDIITVFAGCGMRAVAVVLCGQFVCVCLAGGIDNRQEADDRRFLAGAG